MGGLKFRRRGSVLEARGSCCWPTRLTPHSEPLRPLYYGIRPLCWPPSSSTPPLAVTFLQAQHGGQRRARNAFSESVDSQSSSSELEETLSALVATKEHHITSISRAPHRVVLVWSGNCRLPRTQHKQQHYRNVIRHDFPTLVVQHPSRIALLAREHPFWRHFDSIVCEATGRCCYWRPRVGSGGLRSK
jgi:hypothetical protein